MPATRTPDAPASFGETPPERHSRTLAWVGPFAVFALWLLLGKYLPLGYPAKELLFDGIVLAAIIGFSWRLLPRSAPHWLASVALGLGVFVLWIAPDTLIHGWRDHWIFQNSVTGTVKTSIPPDELTPLMLVLRTMRAALLVPVLEELFWRGWLPRWLQDTRFERIPLGQYTRFAFWATAALFAAEHGPYWEVGLVCGVIYNWWMQRTRSLGDLMIAHGVTNLALSVYVIWSGRWGFWM
jgi:CAAX prenyl protease-like protein